MEPPMTTTTEDTAGNLYVLSESEVTGFLDEISYKSLQNQALISDPFSGIKMEYEKETCTNDSTCLLPNHHLLMHKPFSIYAESIKDCLLYALCNVVPDYEGKARFSCLCYEENTTNMCLTEGRRHMLSHLDSFKSPKTIKGITKQLKFILRHRKSQTEQPITLFCSYCTKTFKSNLDFYLHHFSQHFSVEENYKICPECFTPLFDEGMMFHYKSYHRHVCVENNCFGEIFGLKQLFEHMRDNHPQTLEDLEYFKTYYLMCKNNSTKSMWSNITEVQLFPDQERVNTRIAEPYTNNFRTLLYEIPNMEKFLYLNIPDPSLGVKTDRWVGTLSTKSSERDAMLILNLTEMLTNVWENASTLNFDNYRYEVKESTENGIFCTKCGENDVGTHAQTKYLCFNLDYEWNKVTKRFDLLDRIQGSVNEGLGVV